MSVQTEYSRLLGKLKGRKYWILFAVIAGAVVMYFIFSYFNDQARPKEAFDGLPHSYSYLKLDTPAKIQLHTLSVSPEDIVLRTAGTPLREVAAYGINGGFFYGEDLLSIAIQNDIPVKGSRKDYGSGWFNAKYPRGTLVWDAKTQAFSVQLISSGDQLQVSDRSHYFAQGGISMNLQHEEIWLTSAQEENLPYADDLRMRSGMVYDPTGKLWLIVTPTRCTAAEFRRAILDNLPGNNLEGIFLDGDGSSQMNASEAVLVGDQRMVVQMIAVDSK